MFIQGLQEVLTIFIRNRKDESMKFARIFVICVQDIHNFVKKIINFFKKVCTKCVGSLEEGYKRFARSLLEVHASLLGRLISCEENEVLRIPSQRQ
jgi:hypothetical protein